MKIHEIAVEYANFGWSVLPVKPEEKRPIMTNWHQYAKNRPSAKMVEDWFVKLSGVGVGIATGRVSGVVVLDVESYCPTPIEELLRKYPTQLISRSGSGGYHLFYSYPANVPRVANRVRIFEGADLRADGGFIVLPPTRHPNGRNYEWVKKGPPGAFPRALLDLRSEPTGVGEGWITEALRGACEGSRNDTCARLAGYFFKKGMNADVVEALLLDWNEKNDPPMPVSEVRTTLRSVERLAAGATAGFTSVEFTDDRATTPAPSTTPESGSFEVLKMADYIRAYAGQGVAWAVEGWLPDHSITFLVSPPESYKTWLLLDLAVSVAANVPFLGEFQVHAPGPALIIQQEDSHEGLTDRLALIIEQKLGAVADLGGDSWQVPTIPDIPIYVHPSRQLRFDNEKVLVELEKQIKTIRPRVVLIDPLYSTTTVDNYMAASAEQMMCLKTWRDKYGCSFVIAHHSKKNVDPDSTAREDSWGSQFLNAFLEAGWQIRRSQSLADNEIVVRRHSKVMGNQSPISLTFDISTVYPMRYKVTSHGYTPQGAAQAPRPGQNGLLEIMQGGQEMSQAEICTATGKGRSTVSRQIKQLEAAGAIVHMPSGKYKIKS